MSTIYQGTNTTATVHKGAVGAQLGLIIPYENSTEVPAFVSSIANIRLIRVNSDTNKPEWWSGSEWKPIGVDESGVVSFYVGEATFPSDGATTYTNDAFDGKPLSIDTTQQGPLVYGKHYTRNDGVGGAENIYGKTITLLSPLVFQEGDSWRFIGGIAVDGWNDVLQAANAYTDTRFQELVSGVGNADLDTVPEDNIYTYSAEGGAGEYENFLDENGDPIVVEEEDLSGNLVRFVRIQGTDYWIKSVIPLDINVADLMNPESLQIQTGKSISSYYGKAVRVSLDYPFELAGGHITTLGGLATGVNNLRTDYITNIPENTVITVEGFQSGGTPASRRLFFYSDTAFISYVPSTGTSVTATTPAGTTRIAIYVAEGTGVGSDPPNSPYNDTLKVHVGEDYIRAESIQGEIKTEQIQYLEEQIGRIPEIDAKITYKPVTANMHNPAFDVLNSTINASGVLSPSVSYNVTGFIKIDELTAYKASNSMRRVVQFAEDQTTVLEAIETVTSFTSEADVAWVRILYSNSILPQNFAFGKSTDTVTGIPYKEAAFDKNDTRFLMVGESGGGDGEGFFSLAQCDKIVFVGSSSTESHYTLQNKSWLMKANDFSDWALVGYGWSGNSAAQITTHLKNNDPAPSAGGVPPTAINPTYVHVGQFGNMDDSGLEDADSDEFVDQNRKLVLACQATLGGKIVIGTGYTSYNRWMMEIALRDLAEELGADYMPWGYENDKIMRFVSGVRSYRGFWGAAHPGTRTNAFYMQALMNYLERFKQPHQSIKFYKPRTGVTDFEYRNNIERARKFYSIQMGEQSLRDVSIGYYDMLEPTSAYTPFAIRSSEYLKILNKQEVTFGDTLLCEVITPVINPTNLTVNFKAPSGLTFSVWNGVSEEYEEYTAEYTGGIYTLEIIHDRYYSFDKIKVLIKSSTSIKLSDVYVTYSGGTTKATRNDRSLYSPATKVLFGGSGFSDTWESDWTNTYNLDYYKQADRYGAEFVDIPSYLSAATANIVILRHDDDTPQTISRTINYSTIRGDKPITSPNMLRIEIYARMNPLIYDPDRFAEWVGADNPFTDEPQITTDSYDYGTICVAFGGTRKAIFRKQVGLFWSKIVFEIQMPPFLQDNSTLMVYREVNDTNPDFPMEIADVIVSLV